MLLILCQNHFLQRQDNFVQTNHNGQCFAKKEIPIRRQHKIINYLEKNNLPTINAMLTSSWVSSAGGFFVHCFLSLKYICKFPRVAYSESNTIWSSSLTVISCGLNLFIFY